MKNITYIAIFCLAVFGCKTSGGIDTVVYTNDFENKDLSKIENGVTTVYNSNVVLGRFNNGGFTLMLNNLPRHNLVTVTFDLNIHDNWRGQLPPDGPDIWEMFVDDNLYVNTTFSNLACAPGNICPPQSYPANFPNNYNNPRTGASRVDLPGVCAQVGVKNGTTQYKIIKTLAHSNTTLALRCLDKLNQANNTDPKCDKSWSIDNITIKALTQ